MELDAGILKLTKEALATSTVTGNRIALTASVNPEEFKALYKVDMQESGLNPAKALYVAMTNTGTKMLSVKETLYNKHLTT